MLVSTLSFAEVRDSNFHNLNLILFDINDSELRLSNSVITNCSIEDHPTIDI